MQNKTVCIIPARGGSKRIPRKNIKPFCGKPIIAYSIEAAIESGLFDEVMVSTDDTEIAEIAQHYGASVPFIRSEKNANDYATTIDVIDEVLGAYEANGQHFDLACCIYATAPFVSPALLNAAHKK
ncbi:MAG: pseudaminic acid cytidylyltransferase, partial [Flavobacteriales bacterium]